MRTQETQGTIPRGMVLRWAFLDDPSRAPGVLEIRAERTEWRWTVRAVLTRDGLARPVPVPDGAAERASWTVEADLHHLDIPGVVSATLEQGRCLFARTPLLAALGVAGGRHEVLSGALIPA